MVKNAIAVLVKFLYPQHTEKAAATTYDARAKAKPRNGITTRESLIVEYCAIDFVNPTQGFFYLLFYSLSLLALRARSENFFFFFSFTNVNSIIREKSSLCNFKNLRLLFVRFGIPFF